VQQLVLVHPQVKNDLILGGASIVTKKAHVSELFKQLGGVPPWYAAAKDASRRGWSEMFELPGVANTHLFAYTAPILENGVFKGVSATFIRAEELQNILTGQTRDPIRDGESGGAANALAGLRGRARDRLAKIPERVAEKSPAAAPLVSPDSGSEPPPLGEVAIYSRSRPEVLLSPALGTPAQRWSPAPCWHCAARSTPTPTTMP